MPDIMLDLETLGVTPGSVILSIGAVKFTKERVYIDDAFHVIINAYTSLSAGLRIEKPTEAWWDQQKAEAQETYRQAFVIELSTPLGDALAAFTDWLRFYTPDIKKRRVWGNGANFDPPILEAAYRSAGHVIPWKSAYNVRCHRTLKNLRPRFPLIRSGTHHNAKDDAISQAHQARGILNEIIGWED